MKKTVDLSFFIDILRTGVSLIIAVFLCTNLVSAQNIQNTEGNNSAVSVNAGIDPSSLGLAINIQLANYPGRKGMDMPVSLKYTSKVWNVSYSVAEEIMTEIGPRMFTVTNAQYDGGWATNLQPPRMDYNSPVYFDQYGNPIDITVLYDSSGEPRYESYFYVPRIVIRMPDNSLHELRKGDWIYEKFVQSPNPIPQYVYEGIFYAVDGSQMKYNTANKTLYLADGSRYVGDTYSNFYTYIDRNGNTMTYNPQTTSWTDTLGKTITAPTLTSATSQDVTYSVKGIGGANINYVFKWRNLASVRSDANDPLRYKGDKSSPINPNPTYSPSLFQSDGDTCVCEDQGTLFNPIVLHEIVLPNNTSYKFNYNVWGEVDKITYPSGGYERFRYAEVAATSFVSPPYSQANRGVVERWISKAGNTSDEILWQYSNQPVTQTAGWYQYVTEIAPDNTKTERLFQAAGYSQPSFGLEDPKIGLLMEERVYDSSGTMVRRRLKDYEVSGPSYTQQPFGAMQLSTARRNARVIKDAEVLLDTGSNPALVSTTTQTYDSDLNIIQTQEFNFAEISSRSFAETGAINSLPQGSLLRTTTFDYLRGGAYENLQGLQTFMQITDASGRIAEKTQIFYDETPLQSYSGSFVGWTDPGTNVRGNATRMRRWIDAVNYVDVQSTYDIFGNEVTSTDGLGNLATMEYSSTSHFAYQIKAKSPAPDPSGVTGAPTTSENFINFDFWTGKTMSQTDANGQVTTYEYNDSMNRLTKIISPDGGWTSFEYGDVPQNMYVRTLMSQDATQNLEKYQYFDGLMRIRRTSSNEGNSWSIQDIQYDSTGREWRTSNPFRDSVPNGAINPSNIWKTAQYDAVDRVISVTAPDGGVSNTVYSGNTVVITDPANKAVKSIADPLGRNLQVIEAPNSANPYITNYTYDAVGNLRTVEQYSSELGITQRRYFMYDLLSRLIRVKNPEEADNAGISIYDEISGNSNWSRSFEYDKNDNTTAAQDARGVVTNCNFDKWGRKTQCSYVTPSGVAATPTVNFYYDGVGVTGGVANSKGSLTKVSTSVSTVKIDEMDVVGRVKQTTQQIEGNSYTMRYDYDLAGHVVSQTYPSGRVVNNSFDKAARLKEITGQLPNQSSTKKYLSQIVYAPHWGMSSMKLGNNLREQVEFNENLQRVKIKLGWSLGDSGLMKLENFYSDNVAGNNGNLRKQTIGFGNQTITQEYLFDTYDRLSEAKENGGGSWRQGFTYDRFGNRRINTAITTPALVGLNPTINTSNNRLQNYGYDAGGNMTSDPQGHSYIYDANNLLVSFDNGVGTYSYDGNGRRVKKSVNGVNTYFVYNITGQLIAEYSNTTPTPNGTRYLTSDHTGGARVLTDQSGQVKERRDFLPFGEEITVGYGGRTNSQGYGATTNVNQKFTGKERDTETGFDHFGARYYSSQFGRFNSPDPLLASANASDPQSWNRYAYVTNNPMKYIDIGGFLKRHKNTGKLEFSSYVALWGNPAANTLQHDGDPNKTWRGKWGTLQTEKGNSIRAFYNEDDDSRADTNCHGVTFADGEYWVENDDVKTILKDEYTEVKDQPAQVGDVIVYYDSKVNKDGTVKEGGTVVHSATVTAVDDKGNVTAVSGLGGINQTAKETTKDDGYKNVAAKGTKRTTKVFRKNNITDEERKKNADRAKTFDKVAERNKRKKEKEDKKKKKTEDKDDKQSKREKKRKLPGTGGQGSYEQGVTPEA